MFPHLGSDLGTTLSLSSSNSTRPDLAQSLLNNFSPYKFSYILTDFVLSVSVSFLKRIVIFLIFSFSLFWHQHCWWTIVIYDHGSQSLLYDFVCVSFAWVFFSTPLGHQTRKFFLSKSALVRVFNSFHPYFFSSNHKNHDETREKNNKSCIREELNPKLH